MNKETEQFLGKVNLIIKEGMVTSRDAMITELVPNNTQNTAIPGQFGDGGIFKYVFQQQGGGSFFEVKCHKKQENSKGGLNSNSSSLPTAQLYVIKDLKGKRLQHVVWDYVHGKAIYVDSKVIDKAMKLDYCFKNHCGEIQQFTEECFFSKLEVLSTEKLNELYNSSYRFEAMFIWGRNSEDKKEWDKFHSMVVDLEKSKRSFKAKIEILAKRVFVAEQLINWSHIPIEEWE